MKFSRSIVFFVFVCTVSACTSSRWLLSVVYNRMDNILATEVKEYADFTDEQSRQIDELADMYHLWHRTNHLPKYTSLLREVEAEIQTGEIVSRDEIEQWSMTIESYAREMADCHPLNTAYDLLRSLTDEQVEQVLAHGVKEYEEFVEDRIDMPAEKRIDMRYKETKTWFGRFQLDLDREQRDHLRETIAAEHTLGGSGIELWMTWHEGFVEILRAREEAGFQARVAEHLQKLWTLQDDNFPEAVNFNRTLWIDYFADLAESQTDEQRDRFSRWLTKIANNLEVISMDVDSSDQTLLAQQASSCLAPVSFNVSSSVSSKLDQVFVRTASKVTEEADSGERQPLVI